MAGFVITEESWRLVPAIYKNEMLAALEKTRKNLNDALDKMDKEYFDKMLAAGLKKIDLSDAQKKAWTEEFRGDTEKILKTLPHIINADIYKKILELLEPYRK